jgi:hypothetical protein
MTRKFSTMIVFSVMLVGSGMISAQERGAQVPAPAPAPKSPQPPQPARRAAPPKVQPPLTLKEVVQSLVSLRNSTRVENLISTRGIQFQSSPAVLDILKEFGASPKLLLLVKEKAQPVPEPPAPVVVAPVNKVAGPLNVVCEPKDCLVIVDVYRGVTVQNKTTVTGLKPGDVDVQVFAEGYAGASQKVLLEEGKPSDATFRLQRTDASRQQAASVSMLKSLAAIGGTDGIAEFGDIEGDGVVNWTNNAGNNEEWQMTFRKRIGNDLRMTFKSKEGQCTATVSAQAAKQDCRSNLRGSGENIAAQATSLFLSYQLQDVMQALVNRTLLASETSDDRLESPGERDAYALTLDPNGLPVNLVYKSDQGSTDVPIQVQYSNYMKLTNARYPGKVAIGRLNAAPVFVFTIMNIRSNVLTTKN